MTKHLSSLAVVVAAVLLVSLQLTSTTAAALASERHGALQPSSVFPAATSNGVVRAPRPASLPARSSPSTKKQQVAANTAAVRTAQLPQAPRTTLSIFAPRKPQAQSCSFNGLQGQCIQNANVACAGTIIDSHKPMSSGCAEAGAQCCLVQTNYQPGCGSAAIKRALTWANVKLQYCQAGLGYKDANPSCAPVCARSHNADWNNWRSDCSGLVSYAYANSVTDQWKKKGGYNTGQFPPYNSTFSRQIHASQLVHGDVLNSQPRAHIFLFDRWLNQARTSFQLVEEPGCGGDMPHARLNQRSCQVMPDGSLQVGPKVGGGEHAQTTATYIASRVNTNEPPC